MPRAHLSLTLTPSVVYSFPTEDYMPLASLPCLSKMLTPCLLIYNMDFPSPTYSNLCFPILLSFLSGPGPKDLPPALNSLVNYRLRNSLPYSFPAG